MTREQQLEQALRDARDYVAEELKLQKFAAVAEIAAVEADLAAIDAALAAPQSAEPVAQKPVAEFHAREGVLKWHDYNYMASLAGTDRVIQLYTAPPTDTLRDACKEIVRKWRKFAERYMRPWPDVSATEFAMGQRASQDADELEHIVSQHAVKVANPVEQISRKAVAGQ